MNKKVYRAVAERADGSCEVCGLGGHLELHHILRRKVEANVHNTIMLCYECHRGTLGVHGMWGEKLDLFLKLKVQKIYFEMGFNEDQVRQLMGDKLYGKKI